MSSSTSARSSAWTFSSLTLSLKSGTWVSITVEGQILLGQFSSSKTLAVSPVTATDRDRIEGSRHNAGFLTKFCPNSLATNSGFIYDNYRPQPCLRGFVATISNDKKKDSYNYHYYQYPFLTHFTQLINNVISLVDALTGQLLSKSEPSRRVTSYYEGWIE